MDHHQDHHQNHHQLEHDVERLERLLRDRAAPARPLPPSDGGDRVTVLSQSARAPSQIARTKRLREALCALEARQSDTDSPPLAQG
ncbi:hypothetical protein [Paraburkholderia sp. BCC1885]|uniref:hypothetical protein n=1 Tax=Paraburkholderia sp. BCC1885 TaxID=2562669 RepID=UPI001182075C|nr:hypothetical protein [Paraburkholderia sp. BCC1885]